MVEIDCVRKERQRMPRGFAHGRNEPLPPELKLMPPRCRPAATWQAESMSNNQELSLQVALLRLIPPGHSRAPSTVPE